jgi:hypothetical protein
VSTRSKWLDLADALSSGEDVIAAQTPKYEGAKSAKSPFGTSGTPIPEHSRPSFGTFGTSIPGPFLPAQAVGAECPRCSGTLLPYLLCLADGSRKLLCSGCRMFTEVGRAPNAR